MGVPSTIKLERQVQVMRSSLSIKFKISTIGKFEKAFKDTFKDDDNKKFKGNAVMYNTLGVIQRKRLPEVSDVIRLIKLGNADCSDEQAEGILERWLENDDNKQRGLVGAFCDLCKDLCMDIPYNKNFTDAINNLEQTIEDQQKALNGINDLVNKLKNIGASLTENIATEETTENTEETTEENKEDIIEG